MDFLIFFSHFRVISIFWFKITCPIQVEKHMIDILEFLSLFLYRIVNKILLELTKNSLYQLKKSMPTYIIYVQFKILFKESTQQTLLESYNTSLRN